MKSLFLISFLDVLTTAILIPVVPIQLLILGGSRLQIGILVSSNALFQLLTSPLVANFAEKNGKKHTLLRTGFLALLSNALLFINGSLDVYMASRILSSIFAHTQPLVKSLIKDNTPAEKHRDTLTSLGLIAGLTFVVGPVIGGYIQSTPGGFHYISIILTTINVLNLSLILTIPDEKKKSSDPKINNKTPKNKKKQEKIKTHKTTQNKETSALKLIFQSFTNLAQAKTCWDVAIFKFLNETSNWIFTCSLGALVMLEFKASLVELSYIVSFLSFMMIIGNIISPKIKTTFFAGDTTGYKRITYSFLFLSTLFGALYLKASFWAYSAFLAPFAIFRAILDTTFMEIILGRTPSTNLGTMLSISENMVHMGAIITPFFTGYVGDIHGYKTSFLLSSLTLFLGVIISSVCLMTTKEKITKTTKAKKKN